MPAVSGPRPAKLYGEYRPLASAPPEDPAIADPRIAPEPLLHHEGERSKADHFASVDRPACPHREANLLAERDHSDATRTGTNVCSWPVACDKYERVDQADPMLDIDLRLLNVFDEIYKTRSVSRAADILGLGQPKVSIALSRLRKRFDNPLFVRTSRAGADRARARTRSANSRSHSRYRSGARPPIRIRS